jgi:signal transduction histidine kinase
VLIIIPLIGGALVYVLETKVLLTDLADQETGQAVLVAAMVGYRSDIWYDPALAQAFVTRLGPALQARVMLITTDGIVLASSDANDEQLLGHHLDVAGLDHVLAGEIVAQVDSSQQSGSQVVDVLVPVLGADNQVTGIVRVARQFASISDQALRLRYAIVVVLAAGLLVGGALGWVLAVDLQRPLQRVTQSVHQLAEGQVLTPLAEQGPEEIRLLARAFNTLVERLRAMEQARQQLLSNLVHELGRPLGALRSASQALLGGANHSAALRQELLVGMDEEMGRLQRLLDELAHLHGQLLGTLELCFQSVELDSWLSRVSVPWRAAALAKGLVWQVQVAPGLPTLEIDPDRLAQALGNLLTNAIKYTPSGGRVSVDAGTTGDAVWVTVADTGPGIAPEEQERVFAPFYRGRQASRFRQGMGLGLAIARDLAVAHGGRLELDSQPGQGSRFTLWLPRTRQHGPSQESPGGPTHPASVPTGSSSEPQPPAGA